MSYVRSDGYSYPKDPELDAIIQIIIGDLKRLMLAQMRGAKGSAYLRRDQGLQDLTSPGAANTIINQIINSGDTFQPFGGTELGATAYTSGTATHTFSPAATFAMIQIVGAGGGGGNTMDYSHIAAGNVPIGIGGGGGGGGGGCVIMLCAVTSGESVDVAVGTGGTGAAAAGNKGLDGTASSVVYRGNTYEAGGGKGGFSCLNGDSSLSEGGAGGTVPSPQAGNPFLIPIPGHAGGAGGIGGFWIDPTAITTLTPPYGDAYNFGGTGGRGLLSATGSIIGAGGYGYFNQPNATTVGEDGGAGYILIREYGA